MGSQNVETRGNRAVLPKQLPCMEETPGPRGTLKLDSTPSRETVCCRPLLLTFSRIEDKRFGNAMRLPTPLVAERLELHGLVRPLENPAETRT